MRRRTFLEHGVGLSAGLLALGLPRGLRSAAAATADNKWRTFEVVTRVEPTAPSGVTREWVPVPLMTETDYFKRLSDTWKGNAASSRLHRDERYDAGLVYAEWTAAEKTPVLEVVSRFSTRDRAVDLSKPPAGTSKEDAALLKTYLQATDLIPTDGIVLETAQSIVKGEPTEVGKKLPGSDGKPIPFLMYPQAETANERKDSLDPASFKYTITSKEIG